MLSKPKRRRWADLIVLVAGMFAFMMALFPGPTAAPASVTEDVQRMAWWWDAYAVAGPLALAGIFVAFRSALAAKIMVALAGVILLLGLFAFEEIDALAWWTVILPGAILLAAAAFVGPMPRPEEERPANP